MIEAMKQALKAFEVATTPLAKDRQEVLEAVKAIKQAIAELESQEPVCPECKAKVLYECVACSSNNYPPQRTEPIQSLQCFHCQVTIETLNDKVMHLLAERKPLTNDEIQQIVLTAHGKQDWTLVFARAIEAAHGIKENT